MPITSFNAYIFNLGSKRIYSIFANRVALTQFISLRRHSPIFTSYICNKRYSVPHSLYFESQR